MVQETQAPPLKAAYEPRSFNQNHNEKTRANVIHAGMSTVHSHGQHQNVLLSQRNWQPSSLDGEARSCNIFCNRSRLLSLELEQKIRASGIQAISPNRNPRPRNHRAGSHEKVDNPVISVNYTSGFRLIALMKSSKTKSTRCSG